MQKEKQKAKNIVGVIKDNMNEQFELSLFPEISYGRFRIGSNISEYRQFVDTDPVGATPNHDSFVINNIEYEINLLTNSIGTISTIRFTEHCFFKMNDLIGIPILDFFSIIKQEPESVSIEWTPARNPLKKNGEYQHVYDIPLNSTRMIQVWTWLKRVRTIYIYDYSL